VEPEEYEFCDDTAHDGLPRVGAVRLATRAVQVAWLLTRAGGRLVGHAAASLPRSDFRSRRDRWLVDVVAGLGPAFVKAAQLLSTRADVLPPGVCAALSRLHDRVPADPAPDPATVPTPDRLTLVPGPRGVPEAVAAGSIACVYRGVTESGAVVAVKIRRPGIAGRLATDLRLMRLGARLAARVPPFRGMPVTDIVGQITEAIHRQVDFGREARHLTAFAENLADVARLSIPAVHPELSTDSVLVMDFVEDLRRIEPAELSAEARREAVLATLRGVYHMLFLDGLVHCDLHPGNLYFRSDGVVVLVDAGFTVRLDQVTREKFAAFFLHMSLGDGPGCAQIVLSTATRGRGGDEEAFIAELGALVEANSSVAAEQFDLVDFATKLFTIQRRHGLYADPQFIFPLLSLLVLEGTVRAFSPQVDFQQVAQPYLLDAMFARVIEAHGARVAAA
jgi:ubiquinone biosynthesis protein